MSCAKNGMLLKNLKSTFEWKKIMKLINREEIKLLIKDRKKNIINDMGLNLINFSPANHEEVLALPPSQEECINFDLEQGPLKFFFISGVLNDNFRISLFASVASLVQKSKKIKKTSTSLSIINLFDLIELIACLEVFIDLFKENITFKPYTFTINSIENYDIFQIQVLPESQTCKNPQTLTFNFRLNLKEYEDKENQYIELQEATNFDNIFSFTSSIRKFLRKACIKDEQTNFSYTEPNYLATQKSSNQISIETESYAANSSSVKEFLLHKENDLPVEKLRGIGHIDTNDLYILIQASVEAVAQTYYQLKSMNVWIRETYGKSIEIQSNSILVFRFKGHKWSIIYEACKSYSGKNMPTEEDAQEISKLLNTSAIFYARSDTCMSIAYEFCQTGKVIETMYYQEGDKPMFDSQLRTLDPEDICSGYSLTNDFLREQEAYIPYFYGSKYFIPGTKRILKIDNLLPNEVERMDYLAKNNYEKNNNSAPILVGQKTL